MEKKLISVRTGQSAGEAFGYANRVVEIGPDTTAFEITANYNDPALPAKRGVVPTDPSLWNKLCEQKNPKKISQTKLSDSFIDLNDAGVEWIEFETEDETHRLEINPLDPIAELGEIIELLRTLRQTIDKE